MGNVLKVEEAEIASSGACNRSRKESLLFIQKGINLFSKVVGVRQTDKCHKITEKKEAVRDVSHEQASHKNQTVII